MRVSMTKTGLPVNSRLVKKVAIVYVGGLTMMFLGRLMRSAMVLISLKAFSMARSELLIVRRFWYFEFPNSSKLAAPVPCSGERADALQSLRDKDVGAGTRARSVEI